MGAGQRRAAMGEPARSVQAERPIADALVAAARTHERGLGQAEVQQQARHIGGKRTAAPVQHVAPDERQAQAAAQAGGAAGSLGGLGQATA